MELIQYTLRSTQEQKNQQQLQQQLVQHGDLLRRVMEYTSTGIGLSGIWPRGQWCTCSSSISIEAYAPNLQHIQMVHVTIMRLPDISVKSIVVPFIMVGDCQGVIHVDNLVELPEGEYNYNFNFIQSGYILSRMRFRIQRATCNNNIFHDCSNKKQTLIITESKNDILVPCELAPISTSTSEPTSNNLDFTMKNDEYIDQFFLDLEEQNQ
jgi:hypothetical protein